jgi:hypothetical protein
LEACLGLLRLLGFDWKFQKRIRIASAETRILMDDCRSASHTALFRPFLLLAFFYHKLEEFIRNGSPSTYEKERARRPQLAEKLLDDLL